MSRDTFRSNSCDSLTSKSSNDETIVTSSPLLQRQAITYDVSKEETDSVSFKLKRRISKSMKKRQSCDFALILDKDIALSNKIIVMPEALADKELTPDKLG